MVIYSVSPDMLIASTSSPVNGFTPIRDQGCVNEQTGTSQRISLELQGRLSLLTGYIALIFQRNFILRENQ
jgi:hypothetical protein